jgi:hypothetical protein
MYQRGSVKVYQSDNKKRRRKKVKKSGVGNLFETREGFEWVFYTIPWPNSSAVIAFVSAGALL